MTSAPARFVASTAAALLLAAAPARALVIDASITVNLPSTTPSMLGSFDVSTHGLEGEVDTGDVGIDAGACPSVVAPGFVCGRGLARVTDTVWFAGTSPGPLPVNQIELGARAKLRIAGTPDVSRVNIDAVASIYLPLRCVDVSVNTTQLRVNLQYARTKQVIVGDPDFGVFTADITSQPPTCTNDGPCTTLGPMVDCRTTSTLVLVKLNPRIDLGNPALSTAWDADIDLDASHTLTVESVDVLDAQGDPIPGARAFLYDGTSEPAGYFLRSDEVGVVGPATSTTTTPGGTTTTSATASTSTTLPPGCAASPEPQRSTCRCAAARDTTACTGVTLPKGVRRAIRKACAAADKAAAAPAGAKRDRLVTRAGRAFTRLGHSLDHATKAPPPPDCLTALRTAIE